MSSVTPFGDDGNNLSRLYGRFRPVPMYLYEQGKNLTADAKLVYIVLLSFLNDATDLCCPSYESLMARSSLSRVRLAKALNELVFFHWIGKQRRFSGVTHYDIGRPAERAQGEQTYPVTPTVEAAKYYAACMKTERAKKRKRRAFSVVAEEEFSSSVVENSSVVVDF